jgi:hypothetical protein
MNFENPTIPLNVKIGLAVLLVMGVILLAVWALTKTLANRRKIRKTRKDYLERVAKVDAMLEGFLAASQAEFLNACNEAGIDFTQEGIARLMSQRMHYVGTTYAGLLNAMVPEDRGAAIQSLATACLYIPEASRMEFAQGLQARHPEEKFHEIFHKVFHETSKEEKARQDKEEIRETLRQGVRAHTFNKPQEEGNTFSC